MKKLLISAVSVCVYFRSAGNAAGKNEDSTVESLDSFGKAVRVEAIRQLPTQTSIKRT